MATTQVSLHGCDDSTYMDIELTEAELAGVRKVADASREASSYGCQPVLLIGDDS